jgi:hypothetical protein
MHLSVFLPTLADVRVVWEVATSSGAFEVTRKLLQTVTVIAAIVTFGFLAAPARSGEVELDLLTSYIGNWRGEGVLVGGEAPEPFRCRLTITKGNQAKINYAGRCSMIDMNLSVSGTIAFDDAAQIYQAAMSSNAGFTGLAIGRQEGDRISFDLREKQTDRGGNDIRIGSRILLIAGSITVDFEVEFNNSGRVLTASVPFSK